MSNHASVTHWQERLAAVVARLANNRAAHGAAAEMHRVVVVDSIGSTQDLARERGPTSGEAIIAQRQTAGRGRFGRSWSDTLDAGVAVSIVLAARAAEQLVVRSAVAVATALECVADSAARNGSRTHCGIKWPNDVLAPDGGKIAGILIERVEEVAIIGIGINVAQHSFEAALAQRACSLAMLGVRAERLDVIEHLLISVDRWLSARDDDVSDAYRSRDTLRGTRVRFKVAGRLIEGRVLEVDPSHGIRIATESGEQTIPAALATLAVDPGAKSPT